MLTNRQKLILKAIIDLHSEDGTPVGSKALTNLPYLDFSSATIRYDMAVLEELGYLEKTHTSSGRVPSKLGYKYYIENLVTRDQTVSEMFPVIDEIFTKNRHTKSVAVEQALNLLSKLTNYTAMALGPDIETSRIKKIDFIPLTEHEAVLLIVTDRGHVQHQSISLDDKITNNDLKEVIGTLDELLKNRYLKEAIEVLKSEFSVNQIDQFMMYQAEIVNSFIQAFAKFASDNFYLTGMTNVFDQPEFNNINQIKKLIDMLDRRQIIKLLGGNEGLSIQFGSETQLLPLENMTMVSVPYHISDEEMGQIAILGPSRMAYNKIIPLLEYIAANIAKLYKDKD